MYCVIDSFLLFFIIGLPGSSIFLAIFFYSTNGSTLPKGEEKLSFNPKRNERKYSVFYMLAHHRMLVSEKES